MTCGGAEWQASRKMQPPTCMHVRPCDECLLPCKATHPHPTWQVSHLQLRTRGGIECCSCRSAQGCGFGIRMQLRHSLFQPATLQQCTLEHTAGAIAVSARTGWGDNSDERTRWDESRWYRPCSNHIRHTMITALCTPPAFSLGVKGRPQAANGKRQAAVPQADGLGSVDHVQLGRSSLTAFGLG